MRRISLLAVTLLAVVSLAACAAQSSASAQGTTNDSAEEAEVRQVLDVFGKRLQSVSLLSPNAAQEIEEQYAEFVSPALLQTWKSDPAKAPGRLVSSPWPDRIEISTLAKEGPDGYAVTGFVVEITSVEVVRGGAAAKVPVRIVLQRVQGRWTITEYAEQRSDG